MRQTSQNMGTNDEYIMGVTCTSHGHQVHISCYYKSHEHLIKMAISSISDTSEYFALIYPWIAYQLAITSIFNITCEYFCFFNLYFCEKK